MTALQKSWDKNTSYYKDWTPDNPAYGQCAVTALIVQDHFGGDIISCFVNGKRHYFNKTRDKKLGYITDLTVSQFPDKVIYEDCKLVDRKQLMRNKLLAARYCLLQVKLTRYLRSFDEQGIGSTNGGSEGTEREGTETASESIN
jgi:hypothetical protein